MTNDDDPFCPCERQVGCSPLPLPHDQTEIDWDCPVGTILVGGLPRGGPPRGSGDEDPCVCPVGHPTIQVGRPCGLPLDRDDVPHARGDARR
ncbi:hypothetical protein ES705_27257 [subsurface metagenome]